MGFLIVLIVLGTFINTTHNFFCKNMFKTKSDNLVYSIIYFLVAAITAFICNGCRIGDISAFLTLDSFLYGGMMTLEMFCTLQAFRYGSMSLTSLFLLAAVMIPIIPSWIFWGDPITWNQVAGMVVMFVAIALILNVRDDIGKKEFNWKWFIYAFLAFIGSGFAGVAEKILTVSEYASRINDFVVIGLIFAVICMAVVLLIVKNNDPITIKLNAKVVTPTAVIGVGYGFLCIVTMLALSALPASVVYTVNNGARIILITVIDVLLFKEKITKLQFAGLGLGIVGVVLMSV